MQYTSYTINNMSYNKRNIYKILFRDNTNISSISNNNSINNLTKIRNIVTSRNISRINFFKKNTFKSFNSINNFQYAKEFIQNFNNYIINKMQKKNK